MCIKGVTCSKTATAVPNVLKLYNGEFYLNLYINFNFGYNRDLNLPYADWNGHAEKSRGTQVFLNRLVWENGYTQVVNSPIRGDALLDVYLVRPESAFILSVMFRGSVTIAGYY